MKTFRHGVVMIVWALASWTGGLSSLSAETPEELFNMGNSAYEAERYGDAAEAYRRVLRYRIRDARVEYNLGNAEFKLGNLGRSILHFERARRYAPTDEAVRTNLEFARSFCFDRVEPTPVPAVIAWVTRSQDRVGPDMQAWSLVFLIWIAAAILAWGWSKPGRWNAVLGWGLSITIVLALTIGVSWYFTYGRIEGRQLAVVLDDAVEVLAGPGLNNPTLFTIHEGLTIEVRDIRPDWIQVTLPNGLSGWLARDGVEQV